MGDNDAIKKHLPGPPSPPQEDETTLPLQNMVRIKDKAHRKAIKDEISDTSWFPMEEIVPRLWQILDGLEVVRSVKETSANSADPLFYSVIEKLEIVIDSFLPPDIDRNEDLFIWQRAKILPMLRLYQTLRCHVYDKSDITLNPNRILEDSVEISATLVNVAIEHGADVNLTLEYSDDIPLSRTAKTKDPEVKIEVIKSLLSHGAKMFQNAAWNGYSFTPAIMYHFTLTEFEYLEPVMNVFQMNYGSPENFYTQDLPDGSTWIQGWLREIGRLVENKRKAYNPPPLPEFCNDKLEFLIAQGIDINDKTWDDHPLIIAATLEEKYPALVAHLLAHGASVEGNGMFGISVLHNPNLSGSTINEICQNYGGDVNSVDYFGWTPAMYALLNLDCMPDFSNLSGDKCQKTTVQAKEKCVKKLKHLLNYGADPIMRDRDGACLVHHAAARESSVLETVLTFIDLSDINVQDYHQNTPLHYAAHANNTKCIEMLLVCGADKETSNSLGKTALDVAQELGLVDVLAMLSNSNESHHTPHPVKSSDNIHLTCLSRNEWTEKVLKKIESAEFESVCDLIFSSPLLGCNFSEEAVEVRTQVKTFMESLSVKFNERYPEYAFSPLIRGSSAEGTKVGYPDEFDFMLIMKSIEDKDIYEPVNKGLKVGILDQLDQLPLGHLVRFGKSDKSKFCQTKLITDLGIRLLKVFDDPDLWRNTSLRYCDIKQMIVGFDVTLMWNGAFYKNLLISVDFVASFPIQPEPIPMTHSWPRPFDFSGCETFHIIYFSSRKPNLSATHSMMEEALIKSLPESARQAYMLSKVVRSPHVFPYYSRTDSKETMFTMHEHFTSYTLKNILLKEYCDAVWAGEDVDQLSQYEWVRRVYKRVFQQWDRPSALGGALLELMCGEGEPVGFKFYSSDVYKYYD